MVLEQSQALRQKSLNEVGTRKWIEELELGLSPDISLWKKGMPVLVVLDEFVRNRMKTEFFTVERPSLALYFNPSNVTEYPAIHNDEGEYQLFSIVKAKENPPVYRPVRVRVRDMPTESREYLVENNCIFPLDTPEKIAKVLAALETAPSKKE